MSEKDNLNNKRVIDQLIESRIHLGHRKSRWNPEMAPYIQGTREGIHVISLDKTATLLRRALRVVATVVKNGGGILIVGNRRENALLVSALGKRYRDHVSFVTTKWVGGTLTNWDTFTSAKKLLLSKRKTKNKRMSQYLQGFSEKVGQPDLIILLNVNNNRLAIKEANSLNIPTIGIVDTNSSPSDLTYPIPGNDDSVRSQFFYCQALHYVINKSLQTD
jgi:small subunit ribosomal protein S2